MELPTWKETHTKEARGDKLNPLEYFIYEYEVSGREDVVFRQDLNRLVEFLTSKKGNNKP